MLLRAPISLCALVAVACGRDAPGPTAQVAVARAPAPPTCASAGTWTPLPTPALDGREDHTAVWTGAEVIVWGGTQGRRTPFADGARWRDGAWSPMTTVGAPAARDDHAAVWTGAEMIVWGGNALDEDDDKLGDGGRYHAATDTWRPLPDFGLTPRDDPRAVWTGREVLVWGGRDARGHTGDGVAFDPATNRVRPLSPLGAPAPREDHTVVWTGTEMIVWGGWNGDDRARNYALDAAAYDPVRDRWRPVTRAGAPAPREDHAAIWTGTEMIVWGGAVRPAPRRLAAPASETGPGPARLGEAAREAATDDGDRAAGGQRGAATPPDGRGAAPIGPQQVATGGRYDPVNDRWAAITARAAPSAREDDVVAWTGSAMLVWGGRHGDHPVGDGAMYLPAADLWCPISSQDAPAPRRDLAGVWTGTALVVFGGSTEAGFSNTAAALRL
ncbi:MAG: hypothetical protein R3B06_02490 [Kofleriaceae bacterium]